MCPSCMCVCVSYTGDMVTMVTLDCAAMPEVDYTVIEVLLLFLLLLILYCCVGYKKWLY